MMQTIRYRCYFILAMGFIRIVRAQQNQECESFKECLAIETDNGCDLCTDFFQRNPCAYDGITCAQKTIVEFSKTTTEASAKPVSTRGSRLTGAKSTGDGQFAAAAEFNDGTKFFEGDMVLTSASGVEGEAALSAHRRIANSFLSLVGRFVDLQQHRHLAFEAGGGGNDELDGLLMAAKKDDRFRWPAGVVYYNLSSEYFEDERRQIRAAMDNIEKFKPLRKAGSVQPEHWVRIFPGKGCWSNVGRVFDQTGEQKLSLQHVDCFAKGTIMHELLHALGFHHEQSRADRDDYVIIKYENIRPASKSNFKKYTLAEIDHLQLEYDYQSIMHYPKWAFSVDESNKPTIVPKKSGVNIGQRDELSETDRRRVNCYYKCPTGEQDKCYDFYRMCRFLANLCDFQYGSAFNNWLRRSCPKSCQQHGC